MTATVQALKQGAWIQPRESALAIESLCAGEHTCQLMLRSCYDALRLADVPHKQAVFAASTTIANYAEVTAGLHRHAARSGSPYEIERQLQRAKSLDATAGRLHALAASLAN